ncbi:MAG: RNA polymerase sigma factor [Methylococcales bacterium]
MNLDISKLYQLYRKELLNHLAQMVKCPEIAQELVQESYIILTRTAANVAIEHPRGFLYRTANNLALDHLRHNKIVVRHLESVQQQEAKTFPSAESQISKAEWRSLLHQAIAELPPRCRDAFILHKINGLSYREVARLLDISESAVEKHIIKGLLHCRKQLGKHFNFPQQKN